MAQRPKTITMTLNQMEADILLRAIEAFEIGFGRGSDRSRADEEKIAKQLWNRIFDKGLDSGFGQK